MTANGFGSRPSRPIVLRIRTIPLVELIITANMLETDATITGHFIHEAYVGGEVVPRRRRAVELVRRRGAEAVDLGPDAEHVDQRRRASEAEQDRSWDHAPRVRTSSPSVAAASNPTKLSAANTTPVARPLKPCGEAAGAERVQRQPVRPPWPTTMIASTTTTQTSRRTGSAPSRAMCGCPRGEPDHRPAGTIPISHHGTFDAELGRAACSAGRSRSDRARPAAAGRRPRTSIRR